MSKEIRIRRIDKNLPLPEYQTRGAAGFDLSARGETRIEPKTVGKVPLNVAIEPPSGYFILLAARSSLYKKGLFCANGIGIIDPDYCGNEDEYMALLYNYTDEEVVVSPGDRLMQGVLIPHTTAEWIEVDDLGNDNRGGFGTTGLK